MDIHVRGFQSLADIAIRVEGFTALVGRSNIGKSAIVRAVSAALTSERGTDFVRHTDECARLKGAKKCACRAYVRIRTKDFDLTWEKGDNINEYHLNGERYDADKGVAALVGEALAPIKLGDSETLIQIADQHDPLFLLSSSGGVAADALSDVARLDHLNTANKLAEKDRKEVTSVLKVRREDVVRLRADLSRYDGLDDALIKVEGVRGNVSKLDAIEARASKLDDFTQTLTRLAELIRKLDPLVALPVLSAEGLSTLSERHGNLVDWEARHGACSNRVAELADVGKVPLPDTLPLAESKKRLIRVSEWYDLAERLSKSVTVSEQVLGMPDPPGVSEPADRYRMLQDWVSTLRRIKTILDLTCPPVLPADDLRARAGKLGQVQGMLIRRLSIEEEIDVLGKATAPTPPIEGLRDKAGLLVKMSKAITVGKEVGALTDALSATVLEENQVHQEIDALGVCPTCRRNLNGDECGQVA